MHTISIEADAKYAYDEPRDRFVEVCPDCGRERSGPGPSCRCGHSFTREKRGFFTLGWKPADLKVRFPERCPHCLRPTERTRKLWNVQYTGLKAGLGAEASHLALEVPVCRRVRSPLLLSFAQLVAWFGVAVLFLGLVFRDWGRESVVGTAVAAVLLVALLGTVAWLRRAATWLRFIRFDHRSFRLKARRKAYAVELARLNGGRVLRGFGQG